MTPIPMIGIREYSGSLVALSEKDSRLVVSVDGSKADSPVRIDLMDLIGWLRQNKDLVMGLRETP